MSDNNLVPVKKRLMKRKRRSTYSQRKRKVQKNKTIIVEDNLELEQVNPQMNNETLTTVTNTSCQSVSDILSTSDVTQSEIVPSSHVNQSEIVPSSDVNQSEIVPSSDVTQSEIVSSSDVNQSEIVSTSVVVTQNESEIVPTIGDNVIMNSVIVNSETVTSVDPGPSTSTSVTAVNVSTNTGENTATESQSQPISVPETDSTDGGGIPNSVNEKEKMTKNCDKKDEDCPVCLQTCMHPARLPCGHIFCFLCLKGLACSGQLCPMCRAPIPHRYAYHPELLPHTSSASSTSTPQASHVTNERFRWYYEGRKGGWWQFEQRMSDEIEENHNTGVRLFDLMICGQLYVIDTTMNIQHPKYMPGRVRRILRELPSRIRMKGVAGIHGVY